VDLIKDRIEEKAISNTARVIREVAADIVGIVEAEDRLTLARFTDSLLLEPLAEEPVYPHVMVIGTRLAWRGHRLPRVRRQEAGCGPPRSAGACG